MNESAADTSQTAETQAEEPKWQPVSAIERRVLGVLAEKAKTTPDQYPLSLNGLRTGCNQKSNRHPVMELDTDEIEEAIDHLRQLGAATEIQGGGRVSKYRHYLYEWLGVDKAELAVMAELLLRGDQTEGELRGRAARMEPIADLSALRPILQGLKQRGLVIPLTPEGRGHVVTHALYTPAELQRLQAKYPGNESAAGTSATAGAIPAPSAASPSRAAPAPASAPVPPAASTPASAAPAAAAAALSRELADARTQISELQQQVASLEQRLDRTEDELRGLKDSLGA